MGHTSGRTAAAALLALAAGLSACASTAALPPNEPLASATPAGATSTPAANPRPRGTVRLAFAGDLHFEWHLANLLDHPRGALGPITRTLRDADVTMVNLESAITARGAQEAKDLEDPSDRFYFRTRPAALDVLAEAGVDVVTVANNHGADYGPVGIRDTLRASRHGPIPVIGIGSDRREAFTPYRVTVGETDLAFLAADASFREGSSGVWEAGPGNAGLAAAHDPRPRDLLRAVRAADAVDDVVVVYLHWGEELHSCPTPQQKITARALADAGADVIVGSHAHVQLGSGWLGDSYVSYGLGNFLWYHDGTPRTGVLDVVIRDGRVVDDSWTPARIQPYGIPLPLQGAERSAAVESWESLRDCAGLAARPASPRTTVQPAFHASIDRIGPALSQRVTSGPGCPVPVAELRHLRLAYIGFDGRAHTGELVVHRDHARDVVGVFRTLYDARWPIRRMRLVDAYGGSDARSMAADNTSGFNCRRVAGSDSWSAHAYGAAIDINPRENPDLSRGLVAPSAGRPFALLDRSSGAPLQPGVVRADDVVVRAFAAIGWTWGGHWAEPDYQHFTAR